MIRTTLILGVVEVPQIRFTHNVSGSVEPGVDREFRAVFNRVLRRKAFRNKPPKRFLIVAFHQDHPVGDPVRAASQTRLAPADAHPLDTDGIRRRIDEGKRSVP